MVLWGELTTHNLPRPRAGFTLKAVAQLPEARSWLAGGVRCRCRFKRTLVMKKKFFIVFALVLAAAAGLATAALAQGHGRFGHHKGWMLQRMTRELNLTEAQQAQIKSILQTEHARIQPLK